MADGAETDVLTNEREIQQQIQDGGWQLAWGAILIAEDPSQSLQSRLLVAFPSVPLPDFPDENDFGPAAGARLWALTQLQAQAAAANKSLADVPSQNVEKSLRELEAYLKENRIGFQQFGEISIKAGFATYRRWTPKHSSPSSGPPVDPRQDLPRASQAFVGVRVVFPVSPLPPPPPAPRASPFQRFKLQTGTPLHPTDSSFAFAITDWNGDGFQDLVVIKKRGTATNSTEVHIFSGASNFRNLLLTAGTPLPEVDDSYAFALADGNGDGRPDLFVIQKSGTESRVTEVSILSGKSDFQEWILRKGMTYLPETDENTEFVLGDWSGDGKPDLIAVTKRGTATRLTEVVILSGKSGFQGELLRVGTRLPETDANWTFAATKASGGRVDLVCINRAGESSTEVRILSGRSLFQEFSISGSTALQRTDATVDFVVADWDRSGRAELVAIKKSGTGTGSTEVHVLGE